MRTLMRLAKLKQIMDARSRWFAGMPVFIERFNLSGSVSPFAMMLNFLL